MIFTVEVVGCRDDYALSRHSALTLGECTEEESGCLMVLVLFPKKSFLGLKNPGAFRYDVVDCMAYLARTQTKDHILGGW